MTAAHTNLKDLPEAVLGRLEQTLDDYRARLRTTEVGTVTQVAAGIARVRGFTSARDQELIEFPDGMFGVAANLSLTDLGIILLGDSSRLRVGQRVRRTHQVVGVPVGEALLGRVVDALGNPLDDRGRVGANLRWPIERPASPILARAPVSRALQTGIKSIDAAIPVGRGQRELILGDRQTGKTAIALSAVLNQKGRNVLCVYCAIGQRGASVSHVVAALREHGAMDHTIVVVAGGEDPPGMQFIAPYAATSMAEFFMERGDDVLIVYDDLTRHARAYRELSLLLRRPPGREAYPGDIFFVHARLLERATQLREERGGGSLTALPILETQAQNLSAYIPTNLISITDGQIYLSPEFFRKGQLPAVDIGKSVSRVGGKAQLPAYRAVAGSLRLNYAQFEELEIFSRFGTRLDAETRHRLERGRRVREILKQSEHRRLPVPEQIAVLKAVTTGVFDDVPVERLADAELALCRIVQQEMGELSRRFLSGHNVTEEDEDRLFDAARRAREAVESGG